MNKTFVTLCLATLVCFSLNCSAQVPARTTLPRATGSTASTGRAISAAATANETTDAAAATTTIVEEMTSGPRFAGSTEKVSTTNAPASHENNPTTSHQNTTTRINASTTTTTNSADVHQVASKTAAVSVAICGLVYSLL